MTPTLTVTPETMLYPQSPLVLRGRTALNAQGPARHTTDLLEAKNEDEMTTMIMIGAIAGGV